MFSRIAYRFGYRNLKELTTDIYVCGAPIGALGGAGYGAHTLIKFTKEIRTDCSKPYQFHERLIDGSFGAILGGTIGAGVWFLSPVIIVLLPVTVPIALFSRK